MKKIISSLVITGAISQFAHAINQIDIETLDNAKKINRVDTTLGQKIDSFTKVGMQIYGETELSNGTITNELRASGDVSYKNLRVEGDSFINGAFHGKDGNFRNLNVMGPLNLKDTHIVGKLETTGNVELLDTKISGSTHIIGNLKAKHSNFVQDITITGSKIKLKDSQAKNIHIKNNMNLSSVQTLYIDKKSVVKGVISFESKNGLVIDESDRLRPAQVRGGIIEKR